MKVLITGSTGFLGRYICQQFIHQGHDVIGISSGDKVVDGARNYLFVNLANERQVDELFQKEGGFDCVIHLAAKSTVKLDRYVPTDILNFNIKATMNLLEEAENCDFLLASSATVYGDEADTFTEESPTRPTSVYGVTKLASEGLLNSYRHKNIRPLSLRLIANVGLGATHGVVKDLYKKLKSDSPELDLLGAEPGSRKPYILAEDTAHAFYLAATENWAGKVKNSVLNIGTVVSVSVKKIAEILMEETGIKKPLRWLPNDNWVGDNPFVSVCSHQANELGWSTSKDTEAAIRHTIRAMECTHSSPS